MDNTNLNRKRKTASMVIDGHVVTMSFSDTPNPGLGQLVKNTLIDAYIRDNKITAQC